MQRKIFMQRNMMTQGKQSYLKLFLWSAIALIFLVIVTPFIIRHKGGKDAANRKPMPEKNGMVVKEMPKAESSETDRVPSTEDGPGLTPGSSNPVVASIPRNAGGTEDAQKAGSPMEKTIDVDVTPLAKRGQIPSEGKPASGDRAAGAHPQAPGFAQQIFKEPPASPAPHPGATTPPAAVDKSPKEKLPPAPAKNSEQPPLPAAQAAKQKVASLPPPEKKTAKPGTPPASATSVPSGGTPATPATPSADPARKMPEGGGQPMFSVQVGSFKEKHNAEEMRQSLQKKGYDVVIKSVEDPKLGALYVVQLQPVADVGKASTQMMQIKNEEKVKPVIKRVPTGQ